MGIYKRVIAKAEASLALIALAAAQGAVAFFGEISAQDNAASQTLTTQNTFYVINAWSVNQSSQGVTPDFTMGTLTIVRPGWYIVAFTMSVQSANNITFKGALFINGTIHGNGKVQWSTSGISGTPTINVTISDVNLFNSGDVLDVRVTCTTGSNVQITVLDANLYAVNT